MFPDKITNFKVPLCKEISIHFYIRFTHFELVNVHSWIKNRGYYGIYWIQTLKIWIVDTTGSKVWMVLQCERARKRRLAYFTRCLKVLIFCLILNFVTWSLLSFLEVFSFVVHIVVKKYTENRWDNKRQ